MTRNLPLVIDTCALRDRGFRNFLLRYRGDKILPSIAYVEFALYMRSRNKSPGQIRSLLKRMGIQIEWFGTKPANFAIESILEAGILPDNREYYNKMWRDHAIAAHAHTPPLKVVTNNLKDFEHLGSRVISVEEAMRNK